MSFLFGSGFCVSLILIGFPVGFVARPHRGIEPLCAGEWLLDLLARRGWRDGAAFGVFGRLQVTHINLRFVFLFFAHITFLSLLVVFLVLGCVSRAE
jgi:hypothetical protein